MDIEIIFKDSSKPKHIEGASDMYTKAGFCCIRVGEYIFKYPMENIFSVCHKHGFHWGSQAHIREVLDKRSVDGVEKE